MEFNPSRLKQAREKRGLLVKTLAQICGVSSQTIVYWEAGIRNPTPENVNLLASLLGFKPSFFLRPGGEPLPSGAANFRARSKLTNRDRSAALAAGALAAELAEWIEERFEIPEARLPDLRNQPVSLAAQVLRQEWLLGDKPIPDMIQLLESKGVLVFSLAQDCREVDAFSFWLRNRPIILLNTMKSSERSRFDAAHELGHLLCHHEETGREEEREADGFAGAFLMPKDGMLKHPPRFPSIDVLTTEKKRWGSSLAAYIYRLREIQWLSDWQYRALFIEITNRGFRTREPNPNPRDSSMLLRKVFDSLREDGLGVAHVAAELSWEKKDLQEVIFNLGATMVALDGENRPSARKSQSLRLVQ